MNTIKHLLIALCLVLPAAGLMAQTELIYQGRLDQSSQPFTGTADLFFQLYDQPAGGNQIGGDQLLSAWPVEDGLFQVELDFGPAAFDGSARYLEVRVDGTTLSPRQRITAAPVAQFALDGNEGPQGPAGPQGPKGSTGPQGPEGASPFDYNPSTGVIDYTYTFYGYRFDPSLDGAIAVGHRDNVASGLGSAVLSGGVHAQFNIAGGDSSVVAGGRSNRASGALSAVGGGQANHAGNFAVVPGGIDNCAGGVGSLAAGQRAIVRPAASMLTGACAPASGTGDSDGDEGTFVWADDSTSSHFISTGPNQFLVRATGGVGINTNEPAGDLHIVGSSPGSVFDGQLVIGGYETSGDAGTGGAIVFEGHDGSTPRIWGGIRSVKENSTDGDKRSMMRFYTRRNSGMVERMRIDSNGQTYNSSGAWSVLSDRRLKSDIRPLAGALETLMSLHGVSFEYRDPDAIGAAPGRRVGFVAQEVSKVLPQWVQESPEGFLAVTTSGFEALAVEALRELNQRVAERERRIEELEHLLDRSRQRMDRLAQAQAALQSQLESTLGSSRAMTASLDQPETDDE